MAVPRVPAGEGITHRRDVILERIPGKAPGELTVIVPTVVVRATSRPFPLSTDLSTAVRPAPGCTPYNDPRVGHTTDGVRWLKTITTRVLPVVVEMAGADEVYFGKCLQTGIGAKTPARAPGTWTRVGYPTVKVLVPGSFTASNGVPVVAGSTVPGPEIPGTGTVELFFVPGLA